MTCGQHQHFHPTPLHKSQQLPGSQDPLPRPYGCWLRSCRLPSRTRLHRLHHHAGRLRLPVLPVLQCATYSSRYPCSCPSTATGMPLLRAHRIGVPKRVVVKAFGVSLHIENMGQPKEIFAYVDSTPPTSRTTISTALQYEERMMRVARLFFITFARKTMPQSKWSRLGRSRTPLSRS